MSANKRILRGEVGQLFNRAMYKLLRLSLIDSALSFFLDPIVKVVYRLPLSFF